MGRQKSVPTKNSNDGPSWSMQPIDYIPVHKRRQKKRNKTNYHNVLLLKNDNNQYNLGELYIGTTENSLPESWQTCKVCFLSNNEENQSILMELDSLSILIKLLIDTEFLKDLIVSKLFQFEIKPKNSNEIHLDIYFTTLPLRKFNKRIGACIQMLFSLFYDFPIYRDDDDDNDINNEINDNNAVNNLYENLKKYRQNDTKIVNDNVQHYRLKPSLRPYQKSAIEWMLSREQSYNQIIDNELHPLYTPVTLKSGCVVYYDKYIGYVECNKPAIKQIDCTYGILADEMGLGKTVEVLSLILLNPKIQLDSNYDRVLKKSPIIERISRKRKSIDIVDNKSTANIVETKKLKVRSDWVKSSNNKTQMRLALENWYTACLQDVNRRIVIDKGPNVQCVCGNDIQKNNVTCIDCGKIQHSDCLGYKQSYGDYYCPQCWINQPLIETNATLIVAPISLRTQWCNEILNHIKGDLKVLVYSGSSITHIYPKKLCNYDIVLTTYCVLKSEFRLTENEKILDLRRQKKYSNYGSPLSRIKWWRLCLDEAQTVETTTNIVSAMAQKLTSYHRWAVTGTPISKNITDLYGLIDYLQIEPYNDVNTWRHVLLKPYLNGDIDAMCCFLTKIMWRSSKHDIIDQIQIPEQTIEEHWLDFSAVENYFYKCEHNSNCNAFIEKTNSFKPTTTLSSLDKRTLKSLLAPLLSLRQVCSYPNSSRRRYLATKKPVTSMKDLLEALIMKNTNECEEYLRIIISSLNGLAGIYLLFQNPIQAIEEYRKVLQLHTRFTTITNDCIKLTIDTLQIIHTMYNLNETLTIFPDINCGRTLNDQHLVRDYKELEQKYIKKFIQQSMIAYQDCIMFSNNIDNLQGSFILKAGQWYYDLLNWIQIHDFQQELEAKIANAHSAANVECTINLHHERNLLFTIATWDEDISELRDKTIDVIFNLFTHCPDDEFTITVAQEIVDKATDCHLRPSKTNRKSNNNNSSSSSSTSNSNSNSNSKKKCPLCEANDHLKRYELKLFSMSQRSKTFTEMSLKGSWKPTSEELVFRSLLSIGKMKHCNNQDWIRDGDVHIHLLETIKKEFKEIRKLWTYLDQQICAQDELNMCKVRLRVKENETDDKDLKKVKSLLKRLNYNLENKLETINLLDEHELDYQRTLLQSEERLNYNKLEKNLGIRKYLETLRRQQYDNGNNNPDPCPICKNQLEQHWSIIPCGHSYCLECIQLLIGQTNGNHVLCSVCRANHLVTEISYIKLGEQANNSNDNTTIERIQGNYSTKIEAVINLLLKLRNTDENVKVLIFSTWLSVLGYLENALIMNDITSILVTNGNLEKQIEKFKDPNGGITALLLPIHLGSKGLNLIEATHVVLIEPLLNPSDELQAIGRVHRIGQTKPTVVHKFFVKNTIEESIQRAISTNLDDWDKNKVTLKQLIDLFTNTDYVS